ncbi:MAG: rhodanese-like domain-containing protein [Methylococcales bacterium]|nr:rhodanese-like domain-containing protein [Methylococcales bacterium]
MKKKCFTLMALLMFVTTGVLANSLLKETDIEAMVLIDAHPTEEYNLAYIEGTQHFGFQSNHSGNWEKDVEIPHVSQENYRAVLGADKNKKIVIYCGFTKCGRSHNAAFWAKKLGYTNVYRVPSGISAWIDAGYPYKTNLNK